MNLKGLIYCRVSSFKQVKEWNGLSSQEKRCRDYANNTLWISVEKVFNDEWVSGGVFERKSIIALFKYIDEHKDTNYTVIFEDLNRLSRDIQVHGLLRAEFKKRGVELASPNFQFEESPEGTFRENMSVSMAQYEKDKNRQRVVDRMRARLEQGYWCFMLPIGYRYSSNAKWGKTILPDPNISKIVKQALEKFANDELKTIFDVARYLNKKGLKVGTVKNDKVYNANLISRMLRNILYTGYLEYPKWNISRRKAKHQALIPLETFEKIEAKVNCSTQSIIQTKIIENWNRIDRSKDFPLRGFLYFEPSKQMLSGAWSQWKRKKTAYYTYPRRSAMSGKSINRDVLHQEFEELLRQIQPKEELIQSFEKVVLEVYEKRKKDDTDYKKTLQWEINQIDGKIKKYINRIGQTESDMLVASYEEKIENLEREKRKISADLQKELVNVRTPLKRKMRLVRDSLDIWRNGDLETKKALVNNIFPDGIPVNEKKQVRTPTFSLIYQAFSLWERSESLMVDFVRQNLNTIYL